MLLQIFLALQLSFSYIATEKVQVRPQSILANLKVKGIDFGPTNNEKALLADLKAGRIQPDPYMPEPQLLALKREIDSNAKNLSEAKKLAKAIIYQAVEKRWQFDIEYTVLNDIAASNFNQFSPTLVETIQTQTRFIGSQTQNGSTVYKFQIADWAFVTVNSNLSEAKWNIEFDSTADDNRIPESVKKIKAK